MIKMEEDGKKRERKTWGSKSDVTVVTTIKDLKGEVKRPKEKIDPGMAEYLSLLQERNRIFKNLEKKNLTQIDNEKKEKGFAIYVNGANTKPHQARGNSAGKVSTVEQYKYANDFEADDVIYTDNPQIR